MKTTQTLWTREELILAINLYCKLPFGKIHGRNPEIIKLASLINRTPGAVSYKLVNFASLDPSLIARGIKGAQNTSKLDKIIWEEFFNNWDELAYQSELLRAKIELKDIEEIHQTEESFVLRDGKEREQLVKTRVNQNFFRSALLASYNNTCCITRINRPELLIASHIIPWSFDTKNRLNPRNGLLLNGLHDRAFENGLITISTDYRVLISSELKKVKDATYLYDYFLKYENVEICLPHRFQPDKEFLKYHNNERFRQ
jgi:putative restriction endonuclease